MRKKLNLTIHPEVREFAEKMADKRRRSISQLFEELIEAEWNRQKVAPSEDRGKYQPARRKKAPADQAKRK